MDVYVCANIHVIVAEMSEHHENGKQVSENWNAVFKALSAEPRRQLLVSLLDTPPDQSISLPQSAMMPNVPSDSERLRIELYHVHLPMLEEMEFITAESDPLVASRGPQFGQVAAVMDMLHSEATSLPEPLVVGCQRLETERQANPDF